jgi:hypothetical protein
MLANSRRREATFLDVGTVIDRVRAEFLHRIGCANLLHPINPNL